ncbi:hypothetical protein LZ30DRAFT_631860 [Colletotrichum cereale]|nr:hypothetical protein LZ30DRAFT_631860 [Colletotrichum cereale]
MPEPGWQMGSNLFIQMSGAPGSGKSTMASLLRESCNGITIDHDVFRSALLDDNSVSFDHVAKRAYHLQWTFAEEMIKQGFNVIVDSTCNFQEVLDQGYALCEKYNFTHWYIECHVDDIDLLDERLRAREPMKSQRASVYCPPAAASSARAGEDSRAVCRKWIENPCRPERNAIIVDSRNSPETQRNHILAQIASQRDLQPAPNTMCGYGAKVESQR